MNSMKFTQHYEGWQTGIYSAPTSNITMELQGDLTLDQILENFEHFLKGCGFLIEGNLQIVDISTQPLDAGYIDEPTDPTHSNFYFDTDRNK
jgi:hypothetical protein